MRQRVARRLPCDGTGHLQLEATSPACEVANLSRGGACLLVDHDTWGQIEEVPLIEGTLQVQGKDFGFSARICWSSLEDQKVRFGVEFKDSDQSVLTHVIEELTILDSEEAFDEGSSFNI
jgi:hypothetical protein